MMASTSAGSGWTTSRIIALAVGSVLLLISLAFIAGGGTLAWADQEQLRSGYLTTTTTTYSTSGYALVSDPIKPYGTWTLSLTWDGQRGHWMVVVMNQDASSALTVRAEAGMSAPALAWLAGELLALGL